MTAETRISSTKPGNCIESEFASDVIEIMNPEVRKHKMLSEMPEDERLY